MPLDVERHERGLADELLNIVLPKVPLPGLISRSHLFVGLHLGHGNEAREGLAELLADVADRGVDRVCKCGCERAQC